MLFDDEARRGVRPSLLYDFGATSTSLASFLTCLVDETLKSLRPSVKRSRVVRVLAISYATYIWILTYLHFPFLREYLLECC